MKQVYIAAPISAETAADMERVLAAIRASDNPVEHRREGIDMVLRLTAECLDHYFLHGAEQLGLGAVARQTVRLGLKSANGGIGVFVRQLGKMMSGPQLVVLADLVEGLVLEVEDDDAP
ncbi:MAG: hypothetical protein AAGN66_28505 [Acidobacteriota bacterium]